MKKIILGNSGIEVSKIGLGTINFGTKTGEKDAFAILDAYTSIGGNFIDTANNYAVWNGGDGCESERVIGKWLESRDARKKVVIATKLGALPKEIGKKDFSAMQGLSSKTIIESVESSLKNLKTDYIDLLYLHVDDFSVPQFEVMKTLHELVQKGKVKAIGCSNFYSWRIESARCICKEHSFTFFSAVQQRYSYLSPTIDADFYPQIALNQDLDSYLKYNPNLTLVAYSPLLKGQYTSLDKILDKKYNTEYNQIKLKKMQLDKNPIQTVLTHITESYKGSIALITTSKVEHILEIMNSIV